MAVRHRTLAVGRSDAARQAGTDVPLLSRALAASLDDRARILAAGRCLTATRYDYDANARASSPRSRAYLEEILRKA
jgi:hypothetical protein